MYYRFMATLIGHSLPIRGHFRLVFATFCGLGDLEHGLGHLKVWSTFSLSQSYVFLCFGLCMVYAKFEKSTFVSKRHQSTKTST